MTEDDEIIAEEAARVMHHLSACSNGSLMTDYILSGDDVILHKIETIAHGNGYGVAKCIMGDMGAVVNISDVRAALMLAYRAGARREAKRPTDDPRPADMAELARLTAIELRKRAIRARATVLHNVEIGLCTYGMRHSDFDNLGPIACADVIQRQEAARAQEWAGDK